MKTSSRVNSISESVTLKLNAKAVALAESGKQIYNLTAGQLPFRPATEFVDLMRSELDFIKSYHYSPVAGFPELRKNVLENFEKTRDVKLSDSDVEFDCVISNGGKHSISNIMGCLLDPGDEVIVMTPYWVTYPEIIKFCKGVPITIETTPYEFFVPSIDKIKLAISPKTKAIIVNSPQNPTGIHYSDEWMNEFAELMKKHPHVNIISDEIYYELFYYDPRPTYFYQKHPELLKQTIIVDGISKTLASTGLRLGWTIAPKDLTSAMTRLQGQTTSGANSLVQRALMNFEFDTVPQFLEPIKKHLRENASYLRDVYRDKNLAHIWYQSTSAFYYLMDFSQTPIMDRMKEQKPDQVDYSFEICEELLEEAGVAMVPGGAFGMPNTARMSFVLERDPFREAVDRIFDFVLK